MNIGCDYKMRQVAIASAEGCWAASYTCTEAERNYELTVLKIWFERHVPMNSHLWIESAIQAHGNVQVTVKMAQTQGALMSVHVGPCSTVAPATWKAGLGIGGHADKMDVNTWLQQTHPNLSMVCDTQDEIDAMCMSLYGMAQMA